MNQSTSTNAIDVRRENCFLYFCLAFWNITKMFSKKLKHVGHRGKYQGLLNLNFALKRRLNKNVI